MSGSGAMWRFWHLRGISAKAGVCRVRRWRCPVPRHRLVDGRERSTASAAWRTGSATIPRPARGTWTRWPWHVRSASQRPRRRRCTRWGSCTASTTAMARRPRLPGRARRSPNGPATGSRVPTPCWARLHGRLEGRPEELAPRSPMSLPTLRGRRGHLRDRQRVWGHGPHPPGRRRPGGWPAIPPSASSPGLRSSGTARWSRWRSTTWRPSTRPSDGGSPPSDWRAPPVARPTAWAVALRSS